MRIVTYRTQDRSGVSEYVVGFLASVLGLRIEEHSASSDGAPDLFHGNDRDVACSIRIPFRKDDVLWQDLLDGGISDEFSSSPDAPIIPPFDLISGIAAFLTDRVNRSAPSTAFDEHDRLKFEGSFQSTTGWAHVPIVNRYVDVVGQLLESLPDVEPTPRWPDGKRFAIALSHDVDAPIRHGASGGPLFDSHASVRRNILTNLYRARFSIERMIGATGLEHWHFPLIMDAESFRGFSSSFMFAPTRRFDRHGHPDFDVSYDVGSGRFRDLFGQLNYRGFEIGLHAGYLAFEDSTLLDSEREKLELLAQTPIRGVRHHVWHVGRDVEATLLAHEEAGFEFDSSIAFNRQPVLRRSVALPYRPWNEQLGRALDVIQVPVALMDGHIFYHPVSEDQALAQAKAVVDQIREARGVGAIDWHVRTSSPKSRQFASWGRTYHGLLDYLAEMDDVWVASLGEVNDWVRQREKLVSERV